MDYEKKYNEALERAKQIRNGNPSSGTAIVVCEQIFPELAESEDERIRRTLVEYFGPEAQLDFIRGVPIQKIRDWLEKQKEPENVSASTMAPSCWTKVPEQCLKCNEYEVGYKAGYTHGCTAGYNKAMKEMEQKEQKPAEWSDKDKNIFNLALNLIKHSDDCDGILDKELAVKWFAELPSRFVPQPKPRWSEEDEQFLLICKNALSKYQTSDHWDANIISNWLEKRLKSLRPKPKVDSVEYDRGFLAGQGSIQHWKPSEEQMDILDKVYHYLWADRNATADMQDGLGDLIDELKKLCQ